MSAAEGWLRLAPADLREFAAVTGDHNPLHTDPEFARRSSFGGPIAHGVLAAVATLALARVDLAAVTRLAVDFDLPVLPGLAYLVESGAGTGAGTGVGVGAGGAALRLGGVRVLSLRWTSGPRPGPDPAPSGPPGRPPAGDARVLDATLLAALPAESGAYRPDLPGLHRLLHRLCGATVPHRLAAPLCWASFFAGMRTPGRFALLAGVRLTLPAAAGPLGGAVPSATAGSSGGAGPSGTADLGGEGGGDPATDGEYRTQPPGFDRRTGLVTVRGRLGGAAPVDVTVSAFLRHPVPPPGVPAAVLPRSDRLAGRRVLVVGGSRGLGAALACCLAGQGARVLALSSRPAPTELLRMAGAAALPIEAAVCDAADPARLAEVLAADRLDGLVLAAAPRVVGLPLSPQTVTASVSHVDEALRLALNPLAVAAERLRDGAFVLFISSTAMTRAQPHWPHYVAAKAALEGLARHTAQHHPQWRVLVARPPRMWTEMANSPTMAGAADPGTVAAAIVAHVLARPATPGEAQFIDEERR